MDMSTEYNEVNRISDIIDVIENDHAVISPYLKIVEQPEEFIRYRYESEGSSAGIIKGINSTSDIKTYPTVQIVGYKGPVVVILSCVTKDEPYRAHPHNLVWKREHIKGVCKVEINNEEMIHSFDQLGIKCVKKGDIKSSLKIRQDIRVDPFEMGFDHMKQHGSIDLNAIRLCFHAFIIESGVLKMKFEPVVSNIIYDEKSLCNLHIYQLSHASASVTGGLDMIILCEKVNEDVCVRMFEEQNGQVVWEETVKSSRVHKHVAITFTTPRYRTIQVDEPVKVYIQLKQPGPVKAGNSVVPFMLIPSQPVARASLHPYSVHKSMLLPITPRMDCNPAGLNRQDTTRPFTSVTGTSTSLEASNDLVEQNIVCSPSHYVTNTIPVARASLHPYSVRQSMQSPITPRMDCNPAGLNSQDTTRPITSVAGTSTSLETSNDLVEQNIVCSPSHYVTNTIPGDIFSPHSYSVCYNNLLPSISKLHYNPVSVNYQENIFASTSLATTMPTLEIPSQLIAQERAFPQRTYAAPGVSVMQEIGNQMGPYDTLDSTYDDTSALRENDITKTTTDSVENVSMSSLSQYLISSPEEINLSENLSSLSLSL